MSLKFLTLPKALHSLIGVTLLTWTLFPSQAFSKREHQVYFSNTAYELNIYKIKGK